jgi:predicted RNA methylase
MAKNTTTGKKGGSKGMDTTTAVEIGAGVLAAAAAAGAGYYFYGADNAKKHRKSASTWAKGMKNDVVREAKKLKKVDQKAMAAIIDKAAGAYQGVRSVDAADLRAAAQELKKNWREVQREIGSAATGMKRRASGAAKAVKKATKAGTKKAVKKAAPKKAAPKKAPKKAAKRS